MGYKDDVKINPADIPFELMRQPQLVIQWGDKAADARAEKERLREMVFLVKAEAKQIFEQEQAHIELDIRRRPASDFQLDKMTDKVVLALVKDSDAFKQATEDYIERIKEVIDNYANAVQERTALKTAMEAFRDKRYSLEGLIKLQLAGLYGEVHVDAETANTTVRQGIEESRRQLQNNNRTINNRRSKNAKKS